MSEVKVNKISPRSGTTVTLGDSGDTFTIPSGATINNQGTATNFGATGSASWNTTVKTGDFTAVAGEGYFVNTTSGAVDVTLPAGTAGAVVAIKDYAGTFDTNNCILIQNGSDKINGSTINGTLNTEGVSVTLIFIDSTQGWLVTDDGLDTSISQALYVTATGGNTVTTSGDFKIHTFTGPGTFAVSSAGNATGSNTVEYLVVAGGGGGGSDLAGGGGAGGVRSVFPVPATGGLPLSVSSFPITVGGGGAQAPVAPTPTTSYGGQGSNSIFSTITSAGGGGGATGPCAASYNGRPGGSGGGSGGYTASGVPGGVGNTPPVSPPQGNNGGNGGGGPSAFAGAGGGGAAAVGTSTSPTSDGGIGGAGSQINICGNNYYWGGGGGGGRYTPGGTAGNGGIGGGGGGAKDNVGPTGTGKPLGGDGGGSAINAGTDGAFGPTSRSGPLTGGPGGANSGGGGGGGSHGNDSSHCQSRGGIGGSGIVIIRYKFQN